MAFHTIWSVDLGKSALKAVKLRREKNSVEILAVDKVDYPVSDNGVDSASQAKEALSVFKTRNDVKEPVVVAHPGQGTFSRFIKVPAFDAKKVKDMVRYEASQQIPFPLDEVIWDYHLVNREYLPGEEREVGLFAVRKEAIDDYLLEFSQEGLSVEMLTIGYLGLWNFIHYDVNPQEPVVVLDIGAAHTDLILVDGERFWIRPLPHSGNDVSKAIMQRFKLAFPEAEKLKIETTKAPQQAEKIFKVVIQPKLQELVQEVQRSIGYYRSQHGDVTFQKCYLLGNGSRIVGIKKFLEDSLGMAVERLQSIGRLRVSRGVNVKLLQSELAAFGTALGLGIQAVGAGTCQVDLVPKEEKVKKEIQRKRKHVFFAAGGLLLCLLAAYGLIQSKITRFNDTLGEAENETVEYSLSSKNVKEIDGLRNQSNTQLLKVTEGLRGLGRARQGPLEGLRSIERVLAPLSRKPPIAETVKSDDADRLQQIKADVAARLAEKLWIPYLRVEQITYPEDAAAAKSTGGAKAKATRGEEKPSVPAYKFTAFVMVKEGENAQASSEKIRTLFKASLENDLLQKGWTKIKDVTVGAGTSGHKNIIFSPPGMGGTGVNTREEIPETEGGPYYGAEVQWYMLPEFPPEAPAADTEPEAAPAESAPAKPGKPGKGGKK
jgi:type IV pilus assembly protein PilM